MGMGIAIDMILLTFLAFKNARQHISPAQHAFPADDIFAGENVLLSDARVLARTLFGAAWREQTLYVRECCI